MEEIESPTEHLQEEIHHHALESKDRWILRVALSSALLAVLAAVSALLSSDHANEAMIEQIQGSNQWAYFQAKGVKATVLGSKIELLTSLGKPVNKKDNEKVAEYKKEQDEISEKAREMEKNSQKHLSRHLIFARAVTLFQVAIGIGAIAVLIQRRWYWYISLAFGTGGLGFLLQGLLR